MFKKLITFILLIILVSGAVVFVYFDFLVKRGVEMAGPRVLGTGVSVSTVNISPLTGGGRVSGLQIQNPQGFNEPYVIELGDVRVNLVVGSLFSDIVEIHSIVIEQPLITYETTLRTDNIRALINNIPTGPAAEQPMDPEADGPAKRFIIGELRLTGTRVNLVSALGSAPVNIPDLHLENIGDRSHAVTAAEALRQILTALSRQLGEVDFDELLRGIERGLREELERRGDELEEQVDELTEGLRDLLRSR